MENKNESKNLKCFHHDDNKQLRKKGFPNGTCVIRWDTPCGGTPETVPEPFKCMGYYIPIYEIENVKK